MKRRDFLRTAGLATATAPFAHNGLSISPLSQNSVFSKLGALAGNTDKVMVFIELAGGNDGLNTLLPIDQYATLALHRSGIMIPENQALTLSGVSKSKFHPAFDGMRKLFDDGWMSIVQNVGYPNQDYSHFRSMDIWMTAANSGQNLDTGWLGRWLESQNAGYPNGYPTLDSPDPLAIQIGAVSSPMLMGSTFPMGISVGDPDDVYDLINDFIEPAPATPYGDELTYIRTVMQNTKLYFDVVKEAAVVGQNLSGLYPAQYENELADQLKVVARLINGGLQTPVYLVSIGGFDTHSEQVAGVPAEGQHAELLAKVSQAVSAFMDDIKLMGKADKVCGMTYSEFGRTIAANDSFGTDHGAAAPLFVFGKGVNPGIIGSNAQIPANLDVSADVPMQHDFRSVYASVLQDWFDLPSPKDVLFTDYPILPIFKQQVAIKETAARDPWEIGNFPNPVQTATTITFTSPEAFVTVNLLDINGRLVRKVAEGHFPAGKHKVVLERRELASGTYFYQVRLNGIGMTRKMVVI